MADQFWSEYPFVSRRIPVGSAELSKETSANATRNALPSATGTTLAETSPRFEMHYIDEWSPAHHSSSRPSPVPQAQLAMPSATNAELRDEPAGTLLFVHGNPTWSFAWRHFVSKFRDRYRCVAVDHIGCGLSDKPQNYTYTLQQHIQNLCQLIDTLDLRNITLVAHDWGGAIGMGAAVERCDRFNRFVLCNTAAFRSTKIPWRIAACRIPVLGQLAVRGANAFAGAAVRMAVENPNSLSPLARAGLLHPYRSWNDRVAVQRFVEDIPLTPRHRSYRTLLKVEQGLAQFHSAPMLLVWGERDWCFTTAFRDEFAARFPAAEQLNFPHAGHYVFEEAREGMMAGMSEFLARTDSAAKTDPVTTLR